MIGDKIIVARSAFHPPWRALRRTTLAPSA
jgi:hypothetical protein